MKRGDIVIVVLQGETGKPRPAVIVQSDELDQERRTVIICPLSSEIGDAADLRPVVEPSAENGLKELSQIMTERITAVRRERVRGLVGHLDPEGQERLDRALLIALGLAR